jgi:hypothetical protein
LALPMSDLEVAKQDVAPHRGVDEPVATPAQAEAVLAAY